MVQMHLCLQEQGRRLLGSEPLLCSALLCGDKRRRAGAGDANDPLLLPGIHREEGGRILWPCPCSPANPHLCGQQREVVRDAVHHQASPWRLSPDPATAWPPLPRCRSLRAVKMGREEDLPPLFFSSFWFYPTRNPRRPKTLTLVKSHWRERRVHLLGVPEVPGWDCGGIITLSNFQQR